MDSLRQEDVLAFTDESGTRKPALPPAIAAVTPGVPTTNSFTALPGGAETTHSLTNWGSLQYLFYKAF